MTHRLVKLYAEPALNRGLNMCRKQLKDIERIESMPASALKPGHYDNQKAELNRQITEYEEALSSLVENTDTNADNFEFNATVLINGSDFPEQVTFCIGAYDGESNDDHIFYWVDMSQENIQSLLNNSFSDGDAGFVIEELDDCTKEEIRKRFL